jgi:hypothetical protein
VSEEVDEALIEPRWRRFAPWVGLALLAGAVAAAATQREALGEAWARLRDPSWGLIGAMAGATVGNVVLSGLLLSVLMRRFGRVGLMEMQGLVGAATLLNYLPLRPGMFGRVAYHKAVNGIRVRDSVRVMGELIVLSGVVLGAMAAAMSAAVVMEMSVWAALGGLFGAAGLGLAWKGSRLWSGAAIIKIADVGLWGVRYWAAFALIGQPVAPAAAVTLACAAVLASSIPLAGNGLGLREWVIGMAAPAMVGCAMEWGITADLVHRGMELAVVGPIGGAAMAWLWRRRRERSKGQNVNMSKGV